MKQIMTIRTMLGSALCLTLFSIPGAAMAHHSAAMFDLPKCAKIAGTVRNFEWRNPHSWLWIVAAGSGGADDIWGFEFPAPSQAVELDSRWSGRVVTKGDKVTISYSPLRDGRKGGLLNAVTLPNGAVLHGAPNAVECEKQNWSGAKAAKK